VLIDLKGQNSKFLNEEKEAGNRGGVRGGKNPSRRHTSASQAHDYSQPGAKRMAWIVGARQADIAQRRRGASHPKNVVWYNYFLITKNKNKCHGSYYYW